MNDPLPLSVRAVRKRYGDVLAVDEVSFDVRRGECFGLLGPNGAGKTTTLSMVSTLLRPDAGAIFVDGIDAARDPVAVRRRIGLVPQELSLYEELTAAENLAFFGGLYGLTGARLAERVASALGLAQLADRRNDRVKTFSGGMKRRLNFAVGLLHEPSLVLLDEPTVGVDPQSRNHLFEMVAALKRAGTTLVYTTHYMEEAERLCDRVGIVDRGRVVAVGTRDELVSGLGVGDEAELRFAADGAPDDAACRAAFGPRATHRRGKDAVAVAVEGVDALRDVLAAAERARLSPRSVTLRKPDLETVFLSLTGRDLRDGGRS
jgi:ABC-2 type transport system ATP-binding protein